MVTDSNDLESAESWEVARDYAALLGVPPSSFSSAIRSLLLEEERNQGKVSPAVRAAVVRLFNSPSMKVALYFAALELFPDKFPGSDPLRTEEMVAPFRAFELATLLGLIYLYRRARKLAHEEEWRFINDPMVQAIEVGALVGIAIPKIGFATGMFAGGLHYIALVAFHLHDPKGFKEYRRHLKSKSMFFDGTYEMERWGCTSPQVGGLIVQNLGFGMTMAYAFAQSLIHRASMASGGTRAHQVTDAHRGFLVAFDWIDSLIKTGKPADTVHDARYYPLQAAREHLLQAVEKLRADSGRISWLRSSKEDISPEKTPRLNLPASQSPSDSAATEEIEQ